jgi:hypothetical protein
MQSQEVPSDDDHVPEDVELSPARPLANSGIGYTELNAAAQLVIKFTGDDPTARRKLLEHFQDLSRVIRAESDVFVRGASLQQRAIVLSPSNKSTKI